MEESLPNIRGGSTGKVLTNTDGANGCFSGNIFSKTLPGFISNPNWTITENGGEWYRDINFAASYSSSVYKDSEPVRPLSVATSFLIRY